jgi:hypothetical protein
MKKIIKKFIKGYFALVAIILVTATFAFLFQACTNESYYEKDNAVDRSTELSNFKKSMQVAGEKFKNNTLTRKTNREQHAEVFVQEIEADALTLIKAYGVTEQDLINEFGSLDPDKISLTAQLIMAEEKLLDEGKTLSIFAQDDYQLSSIFLFGVNSTYAQSSDTIGGCIADAMGITAAFQFLESGVAGLGTKGVLKIIKKIGGKYLGAIGLALAVYDFADCMGWLNFQVAGGSSDEVSSLNDLIMIKPIKDYLISDFVYISKKQLNYKSMFNFSLDKNFNYTIYTVNRGFIGLEEPDPSTYTFSINGTINGRKLDISTIKVAY